MAGLGAVLLLAGPPLLGVEDIEGEAPRSTPTSAEELEERWDRILSGTVRDGVVDYAVLSERRDALARYVGAVATFGPRTTPDAFAGPGASSVRLAYYVNAYNAFVIFAVLERDVRTSVRDVRGWVEPADGLGFFWALRFELDGERTNLHSLETDVLRGEFSDARVHAALNCASRSCPNMVAHAYHARRLDEEFAEATLRFTGAPHVVVDDARREVRLSSIYEWYAEDFAQDARRQGAEPSALSWIALYAEDPSRIARARRQGWPVRYVAYDWSLNGHW